MKTRALSVAAAIALLAIGAAGCHPQPTNVAVRTLDCPADEIDFADGWNPIITSGCGRIDVISETGMGRFGSLRDRAAFDLGCAPKEVEIVQLDTLTYGVVGRGQRLVYKMVYGVGFTLDSSSSAMGPVQPSAAPTNESAELTASPG